MEMLDGSEQLISEWETSGMEVDVCCCGAEGGQRRQHTLTHHLTQKQARLQRMVLFLVVVFLLFSLVVTATVTVVLGRRCPQSANSQPTTQPFNQTSGISAKQQQRKDKKANPSAMLTVPSVPPKANDLEWEAKLGNTLLHGGFNYSDGILVVPTSGIYRVFLQITYTCNNNRTCDLVTLKSKVKVRSIEYDKERVLLSSVNTVRDVSWTKSFYTSGLFQLTANSRLRVWSSSPELIVIGRESEVFFGAERLPQ